MSPLTKLITSSKLMRLKSPSIVCLRADAAAANSTVSLIGSFLTKP